MGFLDKVKKAAGGGGFDVLKPVEALAKEQFNTARFKGSAKGNFSKHFSAAQDVSAAGYVAGLGAFSHLLDKPGRTDAPSAVSSPGTGSETSTRTQEAREQAILEARQRRGMSSTVTTTPLGVTSFAGTSKKKLIGE